MHSESTASTQPSVLRVKPWVALACLCIAAGVGAGAVHVFNQTATQAPVSTPEQVERADGVAPLSPLGRAPLPAGAQDRQPTLAERAKLEQVRFEDAAQQYAEQARGQPGAQEKSQRILESVGDSPLLAQAGLSPEAFEIECRGSGCKVAASFATRSAAEDWISLLPLAAASELTEFKYSINPQPDGRIQVVSYGIQGSPAPASAPVGPANNFENR